MKRRGSRSCVMKETRLGKKEEQLRDKEADLRKEKMQLLDFLLQQGNAPPVIVGEVVDDSMRKYAGPVKATCPALASDVGVSFFPRV